MLGGVIEMLGCGLAGRCFGDGRIGGFEFMKF